MYMWIVVICDFHYRKIPPQKNKHRFSARLFALNLVVYFFSFLGGFGSTHPRAPIWSFVGGNACKHINFRHFGISWFR